MPAKRASAKHLARLAEQLERRGIPVSTHAENWRAPVPHIVETAERLRAAYIVMGSHGHTAFFDLLVGSNTHGVLRRVELPSPRGASRESEGQVRRASKKSL